jgi:RNA-directed DNA polymerase
VWILDADLSAAFDKIDHSRLLDSLGTFPARDTVPRQWLKAGVIESGAFTPTEEGSPQGGVISPLLMNVALHGLEEAAGVRYHSSGVHVGMAKAATPVVVRYADDMVACCHSRQQAEQVKAKLAQWLAPRGLVFNEDKTHIVHLEEGFNFLGFNMRRYPRGNGPDKVLVKPSPEAIKRIRQRLAEEMRKLRGSNAKAVLARMNPIIRGWSAYYRGAVSSKIFGSLDHYMWQLTYGWARRTHPNKPRKWIARRYWGRFNKFRNDRWVFGDPDLPPDDRRGNTACLVKFAWTPIVRHTLVTGRASPDDPELTRYWAERRRTIKPALDSYNLRLLAKQDGRCPLCGDHVLSVDQPPQSPGEWERWWLGVVKRAIAADHLTYHGRSSRSDETHLVHASCHRSLRARIRRNSTDSATPAESSGLA